MKVPSHKARPLLEAAEALPGTGCTADCAVALVLDLLAAREPAEREELLGALRLPLWRAGRATLQAAAALSGKADPADADPALLDTYGWHSHAVLASWLPLGPARDAAEAAWHTLHARPRPPLSAVVNLAELHRLRGEHGPARMLLGEAQRLLQGPARSRCGVADRDWAPFVDALDRCNASADPDIELALLSESELGLLVDSPDRAGLRADLWCTWRTADKRTRARLRGVFSGTWLGPLPGPLDAEELSWAAEVAARR